MSRPPHNSFVNDAYSENGSPSLPLFRRPELLWKLFFTRAKEVPALLQLHRLLRLHGISLCNMKVTRARHSKVNVLARDVFAHMRGIYDVVTLTAAAALRGLPIVVAINCFPSRHARRSSNERFVSADLHFGKGRLLRNQRNAFLAKRFCRREWHLKESISFRNLL